MNRSRFETGTAKRAHENTILASAVLPAGFDAPFSHAWGYMDTPGEMEVHSHHNQEVYIFIQGEGLVMVGDETQPVGPGDVIHIPPDAPHTVISEKNAPLLWAAFWWPLAETQQ